MEAVTSKPDSAVIVYRESVQEFMQMLGWSPTRVKLSLEAIDRSASKKHGERAPPYYVLKTTLEKKDGEPIQPIVDARCREARSIVHQL